MQEYIVKESNLRTRERQLCCDFNCHNPQDSCLTATAQLAAHQDSTVLSDASRQWFVLFSWPMNLLISLRPSLTSPRSFQRKNFRKYKIQGEHMKFSNLGALVLYLIWGQVSYGFILVSALGSGFSLQGSWPKGVKVRGRTKKWKPSAGWVFSSVLWVSAL